MTQIESIARIRTLAQELLALASKVEALAAQGDLDDEEDENDAPPVAPYKTRTWKPVVRPGGISREDEIELALEHATTGVTATEVAKLVLAPGERYSKAQYAATYAALKWLQEHVEVEQKGKLWFLTDKGRARPPEIRKYMAEYRVRKAQRDQLEADDSRRAEGLGGLDQQ